LVQESCYAPLTSFAWAGSWPVAPLNRRKTVSSALCAFPLTRPKLATRAPASSAEQQRRTRTQPRGLPGFSCRHPPRPQEEGISRLLGYKLKSRGNISPLGKTEITWGQPPSAVKLKSRRDSRPRL